MYLNCLSCGHKVDLDDAYEDYEGLVRCFVCGALLEIRSEEGKMKSVRMADAAQAPYSRGTASRVWPAA